MQVECQLVYISPEQLIGKPKFRRLCQSECYAKILVAFVMTRLTV